MCRIDANNKEPPKISGRRQLVTGNTTVLCEASGSRLARLQRFY